MLTRIAAAALVAALASWPAAALAQQPQQSPQQRQKDDCPQPAASPGARVAPQQIEGEVTNVDRQSNTVTLRMADGSVQQFQGDKETIADLKVGDRIEAKKRDADC